MSFPLAPLKIKRSWSHGGAGFPIPDSSHPAARTVLEYMQGEINTLKSGLVITTPDAVDDTTSQNLANAIKAALNAVAAVTPTVVFEVTPAGAEW